MTPEADKLTTEITLKTTYSGNDIKLTIPDIKVNLPSINVDAVATSKRLPINGVAPPAPGAPVVDGCASPAAALPLPAGLIDLGHNALSFIAVKLATNPKPAKPLWLSAQPFMSATRTDKALKLDGDTLLVFHSAAKPLNLDISQYKNVNLPDDGSLYVLNENTDVVYVDLFIGYCKKP